MTVTTSTNVMKNYQVKILFHQKALRQQDYTVV